ncbi:hypothetical protein F8388_018497 [Cannabis sativa]|uniref:Uncharacterized protein n=1 Tax=Cannabis sativa TaxID=3483 RepID=A0A7J6G4L4_CANSA|nr:hypothetical protein F8388_018497 [Cannabis sativa]
MYTSKSSSSSQKPIGQPPTGLTRYGSAPGSLLGTAMDSVIGPDREFNTLRLPVLGGHDFSGDSSSITSDSSCKVNSSLHRSHGLNEIAARIGSSSSSSSSSASVSASASPSPSLKMIVLYL